MRITCSEPFCVKLTLEKAACRFNSPLQADKLCTSHHVFRIRLYKRMNMLCPPTPCPSITLLFPTAFNYLKFWGKKKKNTHKKLKNVKTEADWFVADMSELNPHTSDAFIIWLEQENKKNNQMKIFSPHPCFWNAVSFSFIVTETAGVCTPSIQFMLLD